MNRWILNIEKQKHISSNKRFKFSIGIKCRWCRCRVRDFSVLAFLCSRFLPVDCLCCAHAAFVFDFGLSCRPSDVNITITKYYFSSQPTATVTAMVWRWWRRRRPSKFFFSTFEFPPPFNNDQLKAVASWENNFNPSRHGLWIFSKLKFKRRRRQRFA